MTRQPFYEVSEPAYLFPAQSRPADARKQLEEPVRQWCAYELIRAYGINIGELEFERPVRVGSKSYRIDILISRRKVPWVVVECKEPKHTKIEEGVSQGISYADAQEIQAEYVVYTNCQAWQVRRRIGKEWVTVPDLPQQVAGETVEPLTEVLRGIRRAAPLLHKLDDAIEGEDARLFLTAMQEFFVGSNIFTDGVDQDLLIATDNLLRVLAMADAHPDYRFGKLEAAKSHFESYRKRAGFPFEICSATGRETIRQEIRYLYASVLGMIERARGLVGSDVLVLRVGVALLAYGQHQGDPKRPYPLLASNLHQAIRAYLSYALAIHLNTSLPDPLDKILVGDLKEYCRSAWEELRAEERLSLREIAWLWAQWAWLHLRFWKRDPGQRLGAS
jgi:hypothetical protein